MKAYFDKKARLAALQQQKQAQAADGWRGSEPAAAGSGSAAGRRAPGAERRARSHDADTFLPRDIDWTVLLIIVLLICGGRRAADLQRHAATPDFTAPGGSRSSTWSAACS